MNTGGGNAGTAQFQAEPFMFWTRVASSAVLAPIALAAVFLGYPLFHILVALMAAAVLWEFTQIVDRSPLSVRIGIALFVTVLCVGLATFNIAVALIFVALSWILLLLFDGSERRFTSSSLQAGLLCASIPAIGLVVAEAFGDAHTIFWLLAVVWGTDVGAYVVGRMIGGPRLAPVISPNKTWAGAIGGIVLAIVAACLANIALGVGVSATNVAYAAGLSVIAQLGDLAESRFKRQHDVKDSGTWVPGHGGVMDRLDGLWTAAPVTALICVAQDGGIGSW